MGRKYSITIQAHDQVSGALPKISAVVQVDGSGPPRIVELTVGAVDDGPIAPDVARNIDFALLADALGNAVSATVCSPRDEVDAPADHAHGGTSRTDQAHGDTSPADRPAPERPYRRMPDAAEVEEVVRRTRSVGKLAQHYGVPRYTAQAWVNRLRRAGRLPDLDRGRATA
ncbi:hypothetical protein Q5530_30565 [Saccharothrix sp. BKS2]|uniref:hypothetical protein n=1 Tax=Saccharothrix sp. BKS2 TaxID=3064400 RepID=UPI0039EBF467